MADVGSQCCYNFHTAISALCRSATKTPTFYCFLSFGHQRLGLRGTRERHRLPFSAHRIARKSLKLSHSAVPLSHALGQVSGQRCYTSAARFTNGGRPVEDKYVLFELACGCGTKMHVHAEYSEGSGFESRYVVICPQCQKEHEVPARPLRFFYQAGDYWTSGAWPVDD